VTAHEYKEAFDIPFSKGLLPEELKEIKRDHVIENGTIENLKKGAHQRFKKGEDRCLDGHRRRVLLGQVKNKISCQ